MKCQTPYCRNQAVQYPSGNYRKHCPKCRARNYKKSSPFRYFFNVARNNARRRHIPWGLTFQQWKKIWLDSGHWEDKLKATDQDDVTWSLDRKDVNLGYVPGNVQVIEKWRNVHKWIEHDQFNIEVVWRKRWAKRNGKTIDECPF